MFGLCLDVATDCDRACVSLPQVRLTPSLFVDFCVKHQLTVAFLPTVLCGTCFVRVQAVLPAYEAAPDW